MGAFWADGEERNEFEWGRKTSAEMLQTSHLSRYGVGRADQGSEEAIEDIGRSGAGGAWGKDRYEKIWTVE